MFTLKQLALPGVFHLQPVRRDDRRGSFVKLMHAEFFQSHGLRSDFVEQYLTRSHKNVVRGMHFQRPPADHAKLVTCTEGAILDVVVDLRRDLPSYGQLVSLQLDAASGGLVYIPSGCAHGFLTLSDSAATLYSVTSLYSPEHDDGVLWSSIGFDWPCADPILSERDQGFAPLAG